MSKTFLTDEKPLLTVMIQTPSADHAIATVEKALPAGAETMEQQIENLRIIDLLKLELKIPFLFLAGGECKLLRRVAPIIGDCMYLCVYEQDERSTKAQPLLADVKIIRELL